MDFATEINIGDRKIGPNQPPFVIAEIGSNHNGNFDRAKRMIEVAAEAGADAVKFQNLQFEKMYSSKHTKPETRELYDQIKLPPSWLPKLSGIAEDQNVIFLSTPAYLDAIDELESIDVPAYKIASAQMGTFPHLVQKAAETNKPLILSTGLSDFDEIKDRLELIYGLGNESVCVLYCVSKYPAEPSDINLNCIKKMKKEFGCLVGFSDHTRTTHLPSVALSCGTSIVEKHFTLDRDLDGPDHHFALEPDELEQMIQYIRSTENALRSRNTSQKNEQNIQQMRKEFTTKCFTRERIQAGDVIERNDLKFLRTDSDEGIPSTELSKLAGSKARRDFSSDDLIQWKDVTRDDE